MVFRTCIYCLNKKRISEFNREHVIPEAFGLFSPNNLVLDQEVCQECNQYFGDTIDLSLARESPYGIARHFRGLKPISNINKSSSRRVSKYISSDNPFEADEIVFVDDDTSSGVNRVPGIRFWNSNSRAWRFVPSSELESGKAGLLDDLDRQQPVIIISIGTTQTESNAQFDRIEKALNKLGLGLEIDEKKVTQSQPGDIVKVVVEVIEDELTRRAIAKIGFNYLAKTQGAVFSLNKGFDQIRKFIRYGDGNSNKLVKRISKMPLHEGNAEAIARRGHCLIID